MDALLLSAWLESDKIINCCMVSLVKISDARDTERTSRCLLDGLEGDVFVDVGTQGSNEEIPCIELSSKKSNVVHAEEKISDVLAYGKELLWVSMVVFFVVFRSQSVTLAVKFRFHISSGTFNTHKGYHRNIHIYIY